MLHFLLWNKLRDFVFLAFISVLWNVIAWWLFLSVMREGTIDGSIFMFVQGVAASLATVFGPIKRFETLGKFYLLFWVGYMLYGCLLLMLFGDFISARLLALIGAGYLVYGTVEELRGRPAL